jgi:hypothetical protein
LVAISGGGSAVWMEKRVCTEEGGLDPLYKFKKIMSDLLNDVKDHFEVYVAFLGTTSFSRQKSLLLNSYGIKQRKEEAKTWTYYRKY